VADGFNPLAWRERRDMSREDLLGELERFDLALGRALQVLSSLESTPGAQLGICPGELACYTRRGTLPCRVHGCRVCGSPILADTEDWPAPLCVVHAPEPLLEFVDSLRGVLKRVIESHDGLHQSDCSVWAVFGRAVSDASIELAAGSPETSLSRGALCNCGAFALRTEARARLLLRERSK
jgi:hypothetical protein